MIGRRAVVGLSLLCALLFCAFAAQSASAKGTTGFGCVKGGGALDFSDAHCDNAVTAGTGSFGHLGIAPGEAIELEVTNEGTKGETKESTPGTFTATVAGVKTEITCAKVSGAVTGTNKEIGGVMQSEGSKITTKFSECTVIKPAKCTVKEVTLTAGVTSITVENLGAGKNEMGMEFKPPVGKPFSTITLEGAECALKGVAFEVQGTAVATGSRGSTEATTSSGATLLFTKAMTEETLNIGGNKASLVASVTVKMAPPAITFTTSAKGITGFGCVKGGGALDFSDAHCDNAVTAGTGSYGHLGIAPGEALELEVSNAATKSETKESTPGVFTATAFGVATEVSCAKVSGAVTGTNKEIGGVMQSEGTKVSGKFSECTVAKPAKCTLKEANLGAGITSLTAENLGAGKNEMGMEFKPAAGKPFAEFTLEGAECALKGKPVVIEGTAVATGARGNTEATTSSGATLLFTKAMTEETLKVGAEKASVTGAFTVKMTPLSVSFTTTTP